MGKVSFGTRLQEALNVRHLKKVDLANATGISKSLITRYIKDDVEPKTDRFAEIAQYLNVDYAWLMGMDVPMEPEEKEHFELREKINHRVCDSTTEQLRKILQYMDDIGA